MNLLAKTKNVDRLRRFKLKLMGPERSTSTSTRRSVEAAASAVQRLNHRTQALRVSGRGNVLIPMEPVPVPAFTFAKSELAKVSPLAKGPLPLAKGPPPLPLPPKIELATARPSAKASPPTRGSPPRPWPPISELAKVPPMAKSSSPSRGSPPRPWPPISEPATVSQLAKAPPPLPQQDESVGRATTAEPTEQSEERAPAEVEVEVAVEEEPGVDRAAESGDAESAAASDPSTPASDDESAAPTPSPPTTPPHQKRAATSGLPQTNGAATTPLADADRFEELVELEHRENLMRAWRRTHRYRTVPCPAAPPLYLNEPLELVWSETDAANKRRLFNRKKYMAPPQQSPRRKNLRAGDQQTPPPPPPPPLRTNRTYDLRDAFAKRRPIMSAYFERHYSAHRKPPFKRFNVKFVN